MRIRQFNAVLTSIGVTVALCLIFQAVGAAIKLRERLR